MTPRHDLVAELGANGRYMIAIGLIVMVAILAALAFYLGRQERPQSKRGVQHATRQGRTNPMQTRTALAGRPSDAVSEGAPTHDDEVRP
jgi:hypothetical protein